MKSEAAASVNPERWRTDHGTDADDFPRRYRPWRVSPTRRVPPMTVSELPYVAVHLDAGVLGGGRQRPRSPPCPVLPPMVRWPHPTPPYRLPPGQQPTRGPDTSTNVCARAQPSAGCLRQTRPGRRDPGGSRFVWAVHAHFNGSSRTQNIPAYSQKLVVGRSGPTGRLAQAVHRHGADASSAATEVEVVDLTQAPRDSCYSVMPFL